MIVSLFTATQTRKEMPLDNALSKAMYMEMQPGENRRIMHEFNKDGDPCSQGKDPCMNIHRTTSGLKYYCHRCEEGGFITMNKLSPMETLELTKMIIKRKEIDNELLDMSVDNLDVPDDCVSVINCSKDGVSTWNSTAVPWVAIHWLWSAGYMLPDEIEFEIYWSSSYNRLIFPIRDPGGALLGWVGRNVDQSGPKYMTRKQGSKKDRLLYVVEGTTDRIVFTEDIVSALKVNAATGYTTVALLTTALSFSIVKRYKGSELFLWLDGDMMTKSIKRLMRMTSLGYYMHSVRTRLDPKEYTPQEIIEHLKVEENN